VCLVFMACLIVLSGMHFKAGKLVAHFYTLSVICVRMGYLTLVSTLRRLLPAAYMQSYHLLEASIATRSRDALASVTMMGTEACHRVSIFIELDICAQLLSLALYAMSEVGGASDVGDGSTTDGSSGGYRDTQVKVCSNDGVLNGSCVVDVSARAASSFPNTPTEPFAANEGHPSAQDVLAQCLLYSVIIGALLGAVSCVFMFKYGLALGSRIVARPRLMEEDLSTLS